MKETLDELNRITNYLSVIKEKIEKELVKEGVYDPGILKCVFMAGGPASGKSFVAKSLFGIEKLSVSYTGLKSVNSDTAFERELKKNGISPKDLDKIAAEDPERFLDITQKPGGLRDKAKKLTGKMKSFYEEGRLGMIIDGTGRDYAKISSQRKQAMELGYDCYMVFVNTSLESALEANRKRDRTLPDYIVQEAWKSCQENMGKFQSLFGSGNFLIVDNTNKVPVGKDVQKAIRSFISREIQNPIGKKWVLQQKELKSKGLI
jgi:predicted kinase